MSKKGKKSINTKSFLESLVQWGAVLIFTVLPLLYFSGRSGSYITSKEYFLIGTVDILVVLWAWLLLVDSRYRLSKKNLFYLSPLFLFLIAQTISAFAGVDPATSFYSKIESGTGLILLYHAFLLVCIVTSLIRVNQKRVVKYILQANVFASSALAIATFFTGPGHGLWDIGSEMLNKSSGGAMMGNSLLAGAYFVFSVFLNAYLVTQEDKTYKKIFYYIGIGLMIISPIFLNVQLFKGGSISFPLGLIGQARVATAALIGGIITSFFIWLTLQKEKKIARTVGIIGLVLGVLIVIGGIKEAFTTDSSLQRFIVTESGNRITDWKESIQGIQERPLLGWGYENSHVVYQKYLDPVVFGPGRGDEVWAVHPHNNTLEVLVNGGVIGFIFYVFVFVALFYGIWNLYKTGVLGRKAVALLIGMLIAFMLQQQMIYESIVSYVMLFFIVAIVAGLQSTTDDQKQFKYIDGATYGIGAAIAVVMLPIWLYGAYYPAQKFKEFQSVADAHSDQRVTMYEHLFHSAGSYAVNTDPEFYTDPLLYSYDGSKEVIKDNPVYQKVASDELAALVKAVDPIWQESPYNYHLSLSLVQIQNLRFYLTGDKTVLTMADEYAERAFALSPTDPQIYFAYAQTLAYEGNTEGAKTMLDKAISLNANYKPAVEYRKLFK